MWGVGAVMLLAACGGSSTGGGDDAGSGGDGSVLADGAAQHQDGAGGQQDAAGGAQDGAGGQQDAAGGAQDGGNCIPAATPGPGGMNQGQACLGCHAFFTGSRHFTLAGNIFTSAAGTTPLAGATLKITDASNQVVTLVSGPDGAFYTGQAVTFPITINASKCPDTQTMPSQPSSGDCQQSGCHSAGNRIHLP
jgi:hypothetical protein